MAPPTSPEVHSNELQDGLHQLLQQNTGTQHQSNQYPVDNGSYIPSMPPATYNTPEPEGGWYMDQYGNQKYMYHNRGANTAESQFDGYSQPIFTGHHGSPYQGHTIPQQHQYPNPAFYSPSPPPMKLEQNAQPRRTTRQNRLAVQTDSRRSSPRQKLKGAKNAKPKTLGGPLSELTKDMDIPIKDTEAWVNRSMEERQKEASKDNFVKRPSNSFILYRSAYADRARSFQKSANHQVVSSLAGESWAMEPPEIRKQYDTWAKIERENHARAFPDYKFQPQTNKISGRKRKDRVGDSDEEESDLESDYTYNPRTSIRPLKSKRQKNAYRDSSYTPSGTSLEDYDPNGLEASQLFHPSSYQANNPGKPMPLALNQLGGTQYYQTASYPNQRLANQGYIEDVMMQPTDVPPGYHQPGAPVIGIPGAYHHELQGEDNGQSMLNQLDPMLANYDQSQPGISLGNGQISQGQDVTPAPHSGFQIGQFSPVLNDFESDHGDAIFGSDEWWKQNKDR